MVIGLHHVGRTVTDLARVSDDLRAITGWPIEIEPAEGDPLVAGRAVVATARAAGPNGFIELVQVDASPGRRREVNEPGLTHAAVQIGRIEDVVARLDAAGVDRHPGPVELGTGFKYLYVRDAEAMVTEVEGAPHAPADLDAWLGHGAIATHDIDRLRAAYEALLETTDSRSVHLRGHEAFDQAADLEGVDVTASWVLTANGSVELWQYHNPPTEPSEGFAYEHPGAGHLAFETDDLAGDLDRAVGAGFALADEPTTTDGVDIARIVDPDGNWVELIHFHDRGDVRSLRNRPDLGRVGRMNALLPRNR